MRWTISLPVARPDARRYEWGVRQRLLPRPRPGTWGLFDDWAARLVQAEGVLLLPGSQFGFGGNHFRLGFGRTDLPVALERLDRFAERTLR